MRFHRITAGVYQSRDGLLRILRTEWEGPKGGKVIRWEYAEKVGADWVIDSPYSFLTLRAAIRWLER